MSLIKKIFDTKRGVTSDEPKQPLNLLNPLNPPSIEAVTESKVDAKPANPDVDCKSDTTALAGLATDPQTADTPSEDDFSDISSFSGTEFGEPVILDTDDFSAMERDLFRSMFQIARTTAYPIGVCWWLARYQQTKNPITLKRIRNHFGDSMAKVAEELK